MNEGEKDYFSNTARKYSDAHTFQRARVVKLSGRQDAPREQVKKSGKISEAGLARIQKIIDRMPIACIVQDTEFRILYANTMAEELFGYPLGEMLHKKSFGIINPEHLQPYFNDLMQDLQRGNIASDGRAAFTKKNGETMLCDWSESPLYGEDGTFEGVICMYQDVTEKVHNQWLLESQTKILEAISGGQPLPETLDMIILHMEDMALRVKGSILLLDKDEKTLWTGAGPSLPEEYNRLVDRLQVSDRNGSCGTAAYRKEMITSCDISTDIIWEKYKDIAAHFGLAACTSIPIFGSRQQVLGTFAFYYAEKTAPSSFELKLIKVFSGIAAIAIEKHLSEKQSKEKEDLYRHITENTNDLIFVTDGEGKIRFACSSVIRILDTQPEDLKGRKVEQFFFEEDRPFFNKLLKQEADESPEYSEFRIPVKDMWVEVVVTTIDIKQSKQRLVVLHDITRRKISDDALKRSAYQLQQAEAIVNMGSYEWDLRTNEYHWSDQIFRMFGYEPHEIEPTFEWFLNQVQPEDREWIKQAFNKAVKESPTLELVIPVYKKDGTQILLDSKCKFIYNEEGVAVKALGTAQDITARKRIEDALRLSENKFRAAFEFAHIGICLLDTDACFTRTNKACSAILGYEKKVFEALKIADIIHTRHREELSYTLHRMLKGSLHSWTGEMLLKHLRGHYIWAYLTLSLLRDEDNKPLHFILVIQDISGKKEAEENQRMLTHNLIEQNKSLQQFSYITSHNLRTPISNILGLVEVFNLNPNDPDRDKILFNLKKAANNLDTIIKDLNNIISLKKGSEENRQEIFFEDLLKIIRKNLEKQLKESDATILLNFEAAPSIHSILSYTLSILSNLVENAIKYRSGRRKLIIRISSRELNNFVCLSVCDNGLGINLDMQGDKVFGMYKRFHPQIEGKGIGLHLVKTQMESMGGKVEIRSKPNVGTCFRLFFKKY